MRITSNPGNRTGVQTSTILALLCEYHHRRMHTKEWTMSGDANEELTFVGPTGRAMTSRPSPMWTAATGRVRKSGGRQQI